MALMRFPVLFHVALLDGLQSVGDNNQRLTPMQPVDGIHNGSLRLIVKRSHAVARQPPAERKYTFELALAVIQ